MGTFGWRRCSLPDAVCARGLSREIIDQAVINLEICELPAARGCTYVVPAADFALALKVGQGFSTTQEIRQACKLGATVGELDRLCVKVLDALAGGPLDPKRFASRWEGRCANSGPKA